ncbi:hypothetical protein [Algoriphagus mannitolivorans]|uniref:hypothetical protein n=1 Tax=Algoriphagus mannitolivorans TaxID=226504 RepID=UPI0004019808|nr:hypothetical protein [Algoriphagus mannitolivorans]
MPFAFLEAKLSTYKDVSLEVEAAPFASCQLPLACQAEHLRDLNLKIEALPFAFCPLKVKLST